MRKLTAVRIVAVLALAGSAVTGAVLATAGVSAAKGPKVLTAQCSSIAGTTTIAIETSGSAASVVQGCTGEGGTTKVTPYGTDVSTLTNASPTDGGGNGTIYWSDKTTTTYTYSVTAPATPFTCPDFFGESASGSTGGEEVLTVSGIGGNSKVNTGGTTDVCYYISSDANHDIYETSVGGATF
jgi:hypothetical protein